MFPSFFQAPVRWPALHPEPLRCKLSFVGSDKTTPAIHKFVCHTCHSPRRKGLRRYARSFSHLFDLMRLIPSAGRPVGRSKVRGANVHHAGTGFPEAERQEEAIRRVLCTEGSIGGACG